MGISGTPVPLFVVLLLVDSGVTQSDAQKAASDLGPDSVFQEAMSDSHGHNDTMCEVLLNKFSDSAAKFTHCANHFSRPIRMCRACKDLFLDVEKYFGALEHSEQRGINCRDLLTGQDKVEVIQETHAFIAGPEGLWAKAYCSECYTSPFNRTSVLTEDAVTFFALFKTTQDCFTMYPNNSNNKNSPQNKSEACYDCYNDYNDLLDFYRDTYFRSTITDDYQQTGICFDILDAMNSTQRQWGAGYFNCVRTIKGSAPLISALLVVLTTPFLFYLGVRFGPGTRRARERVITQTTFQESMAQAQESVEEEATRRSVGDTETRQEFILSDT